MQNRWNNTCHINFKLQRLELLCAANYFTTLLTLRVVNNDTTLTPLHRNNKVNYSKCQNSN